jgi:hypothetical protein
MIREMPGCWTVSLLLAGVGDMRGPARSTLQIIFPFEPRSDLLHHFATIDVVC